MSECPVARRNSTIETQKQSSKLPLSFVARALVSDLALRDVDVLEATEDDHRATVHEGFGVAYGGRTHNLRIHNPLLCRLS